MEPIYKVCIITGAGSGIGKATAIEVSTKPTYYNLVLIGRDLNSLKDTKSQMENKNHNIVLAKCDLSDLDALPGLIKNIYDEFGRIDCLLNIAGYTEPSSLLDTTLDNFKHTYEINVFSVFLLIKESVKYMKAHGGKILNVASTAGITPRPGWISYSSSKAAVVSMS